MQRGFLLIWEFHTCVESWPPRQVTATPHTPGPADIQGGHFEGSLLGQLRDNTDVYLV